MICEYELLCFIGIVKHLLFRTLLRQWADRFEVIKQLAIKFGLMVPVIDESCDDPDKHLLIVPSLLSDNNGEESLISSIRSSIMSTFYLLFSTSESFIESNDILTLSIIRKLGFLPKGLFSRLLAKLIAWCQLTSGALGMG
jgi:hypothetical protein